MIEGVVLNKLAIHDTVEIDTAYYGRKHYFEFAPDMWIRKDSTVREVFEAAGWSSFDGALPQEWVKQNYWDRGKGTPLGVWSYDRNGAFGEFVPIEEAYRKLAEIVREKRKHES